MKVEDCIVTVERRTLGECVDLAFVFSREFAAPLFRIWLVCAAPSCLLVWILASRSTDMFLPSILIFLVFSSIFSALLTAATGPQVFGIPMSLRSGFRAWRRRFPAWLLLTMITRFFQFLSGFCLLLPSVIVTAYAGHFPEVLLLEDAQLSKVTARLKWLSAGGGSGRNQGRLAALFGYWFAMTAGIFLLLEFVAGTFIGKPIFFARLIGNSARFDETFAQLLFDDPAFLTALQLAIWIPYPVIRLAWFFCYLDQRIRNECWDLQVQLRAEAARLEQLA
ncbi:MAG: hypothetical protein ACKO2P_01525 [Planctomycetota bacterium]